jgi:hypothetical protein
MLPFTSAQFFDVFGAYNEAIWPIQIVAYGLGLAATVLLFRPSGPADRVISGTLALMWVWTGVAYHWLHFYPINPAALFFALGFAAQGAIFLLAGVIQDKLRFAYAFALRPAIGLALISYAGVIYPLVGIALGHVYPKAPQFGVTPCPVTIFTFGCLLLLKSPAKWWVFTLPVLWSLIGGTAAFLLDVPQDWILLASGPATVALLAFFPPQKAR